MLSLGIKCGSKISVGTSIVDVVDIRSAELILIKIDGGEPIVITDQSREEVLPNVFVQAGSSDTTSGFRLAFSAPKSIRIFRVNKVA